MSSKTIPPLNIELKGKMSKFLELHVGYASPLAVKEEEEGNEIFFNIHITINGFHWTETIEYRFLYDLNANITPFSDDENLNNFANLDVDEYAAIHRMLLANDYNEPSVKILLSTARTIQTWLYTILCHLHKIDEESRAMCKQLFFRSEEKLVKFDYLLKILKNKDVANGHYNADPAETSYQSINRVFKAMTSLFSTGGGGENPSQSQPKLSVSNLEKHVKLQERQSITNRDEAAMSVTSKPKKKSIFSRSMGTKSAMDKRDLERAQGGPIVTPQHTALDVAKNTALVKIEVTRGNEALQGVVWYDIILRATGKKVQQQQQVAKVPPKQKSNTSTGSKSPPTTPPPQPSTVYRTSQRFSSFKKLWLQLNEVNQQFVGKATGGSATANANANADETTNRGSLSNSPFINFILLIKAPFPALPMKCYLGFSLNESELSQRTRMLDEWFRDMCVNYKNMPAAARLLVRNFLKFDANRATDAFFRDQLEWGTVETNQRKGTPVIVLQQHVLDAVPEDIRDELETMSIADSQGGGGPGQISHRLAVNDIHETRTERSYQSRSNLGNSELQNLIWETASQGGVSKVPIRDVRAPRTVIKR